MEELDQFLALSKPSTSDELLEFYNKYWDALLNLAVHLENENIARAQERY